MDNGEVADILEEYAGLLELNGEDVFRVNAYRRAAKAIRAYPASLEELAAKNGLTAIPGIGQAIAEKVEEILRTGRLKALEELRSRTPAGLVELLSVPFVGPKTAKLLYERFGVTSRRELLRSLRDGSLVSGGFSEKVAEKILDALERLGESAEKMLLVEGMDEASTIIDRLGSSGRFELLVCGSIRRGKEVVGDVDIVVLPKDESETLLDLAPMLEGGTFLARGAEKLSWISPRGVQFDFRLARKEFLGAITLYFTGSKEHNVALRRRAQLLGYSLSEYGLFSTSSGVGEGERVAGRSEEEVYSKLGLKYVPPELRENTGEIEAASQGRLPVLVEAQEVHGDFHVHSTWSDGMDALEAMVEAAVQHGYRYVVFTDHSASQRVANGMSEERLRRQAEAIERLRSRFGSIEILHGSEVDILREGRLDYDDRVLGTLDYVVASLHRRFTDDVELLTEAVTKALANRHVDTLGHPTNRLLGRRPENGVDLEKVIRATKSASKFLEVDGQPRRMDLPSAWVKRAVEEGVELVLSSDAHSKAEMAYIMFALINARRGWATAKNVVNASPKFRRSGG